VNVCRRLPDIHIANVGIPMPNTHTT